MTKRRMLGMGDRLLADLKGSDTGARHRAAVTLSKEFRGKGMIEELYRNDIINELSTLVASTSSLGNTRYSAGTAVFNAAKRRGNLPDESMNILFFEGLSDPKKPGMTRHPLMDFAKRIFNVLSSDERKKAAMLLKKSLLGGDAVRTNNALAVIDRAVFDLRMTYPRFGLRKREYLLDPYESLWITDILVPLGHVRANAQLHSRSRAFAEEILGRLSRFKEFHFDVIEALNLGYGRPPAEDPKV